MSNVNEKVYISGTTDYKERFGEAKKRLEERGFAVKNPVEYDPIVVRIYGRPSWEDYMRYDIRLLVNCDSIYMLKGWQNSRGAKLEHHIAQELGMKIYYEDKE